jgi:putative membrane-bound dehydrogenase-like protein
MIVWATVVWADSPRTPEAERQTFALNPGLTVELVASEPQIQSPVAMAFDEAGRLYVVEMRDYPNGPGPGQDPQGRIQRLEDRDRDGFFEHAVTFAEGLLFANGLLPWRGGLIVTAAPQILYLKDTDGDGRADQRDVWFEGFAAENPQLRVSHPTLGVDGWVTVANGLRGGRVRRAGGGPEVELGTHDFRFNPLDPDQYELTAGMGQFGNTTDDFGRRFVCTNRNHLIPILEPTHLVRANPAVPPRPLQTDNQGPGGAAAIFPISRNFTTSGQHAGSFSAACGITIYLGDALGPEYLHAILTCDPTGNLVHRESLTPEGAGWRGRRVELDREFLASSDDWFRPVFLAHGPDGALYVVDMYRAVIEHPGWMPPELKNRPDLHAGAELGRIWRIVPERWDGSPHPRSLAELAPVELIGLLESPSGWHRSTASRLLRERGISGLEDRLKAMVRNGRTPESRSRAAWLLTDSPDPRLLEVAAWLAGDPDARVREQAPACLVARGAAATADAAPILQRLARDPDPRVRYLAALGLSWSNDPAKLSALTEAAIRGSDDLWTRRAVFHAVRGDEPELLSRLAQSDGFFASEDPGHRTLWREAARLVAACGAPQPVLAAIEILRDQAIPNAWRLRGLTGLVEGLASHGQTLDQVVRDPALNQDEARRALRWVQGLVRELTEPTADFGLDAEERLAGIGLLGLLPPDEARRALVALVQGQAEPSERLQAARVLAATFSDADVAEELLRAWTGAPRVLRRELGVLLAARADRADRLLDAVEAGSVSAGDLDLVVIRSLTVDAPEPLRSRARRILAEWLPADRSEVLARYRMAATIRGDVERGRTVFARACAACHKVGGLGTPVGPDIADTLGKSREQLLHDILNPNAAIDADYLVYRAATRDGRVLTGLLVGESAEAIRLREAEGREQTVCRSELEELASTGRSLMPEGVETDVSPDEMADLLTFLKEHRYQAAGIPTAADTP